MKNKNSTKSILKNYPTPLPFKMTSQENLSYHRRRLKKSIIYLNRKQVDIRCGIQKMRCKAKRIIKRKKDYFEALHVGGYNDQTTGDSFYIRATYDDSKDTKDTDIYL